MDQLWVYHTGGLGPPNLLAEAKSDENEQTEAESAGSDTSWPQGPGVFCVVYFLGLELVAAVGSQSSLVYCLKNQM